MFYFHVSFYRCPCVGYQLVYGSISEHCCLNHLNHIGMSYKRCSSKQVSALMLISVRGSGYRKKIDKIAKRPENVLIDGLGLY